MTIRANDSVEILFEILFYLTDHHNLVHLPSSSLPQAHSLPAAKMGYYDWVFAVGVTFALLDAMGCGANDVATA